MIATALMFIALLVVVSYLLVGITATVGVSMWLGAEMRRKTWQTDDQYRAWVATNIEDARREIRLAWNWPLRLGRHFLEAVFGNLARGLSALFWSQQ